jgi:hypothetical protein
MGIPVSREDSPSWAFRPILPCLHCGADSYAPGCDSSADGPIVPKDQPLGAGGPGTFRPGARRRRPRPLEDPGQESHSRRARRAPGPRRAASCGPDPASSATRADSARAGRDHAAPGDERRHSPACDSAATEAAGRARFAAASRGPSSLPTVSGFRAAARRLASGWWRYRSQGASRLGSPGSSDGPSRTGERASGGAWVVYLSTGSGRIGGIQPAHRAPARGTGHAPPLLIRDAARARPRAKASARPDRRPPPSAEARRVGTATLRLKGSGDGQRCTRKGRVLDDLGPSSPFRPPVETPSTCGEKREIRPHSLFYLPEEEGCGRQRLPALSPFFGRVLHAVALGAFCRRVGVLARALPAPSRVPRGRGGNHFPHSLLLPLRSRHARTAQYCFRREAARKRPAGGVAALDARRSPDRTRPALQGHSMRVGRAGDVAGARSKTAASRPCSSGRARGCGPWPDALANPPARGWEPAAGRRPPLGEGSPPPPMPAASSGRPLGFRACAAVGGRLPVDNASLGAGYAPMARSPPPAAGGGGAAHRGPPRLRRSPVYTVSPLAVSWMRRGMSSALTGIGERSTHARCRLTVSRLLVGCVCAQRVPGRSPGTLEQLARRARDGRLVS